MTETADLPYFEFAEPFELVGSDLAAAPEHRRRLMELMSSLAPGRFDEITRLAGGGATGAAALDSAVEQLCATSYQWEQALLDVLVADGVDSEVASGVIARLLGGQGRGEHARVGWCRRVAMGGDPDAEARIRAMLPFVANTFIRNTAAHELLRVIAQRGDIDAFLAEQAKWNSKRRKELGRVRDELVAAVTRCDGLAAGLAVAARNHVKRPDLVALRSHFAAASLADIDAWFDEHPAHDVNEQRIDTMMAAFRHDPQVSTDARKRLFELVDAADPDRRGGDFRIRDSYLMELGFLGDVTSKRWIVRCRQRIRNPAVKRELTTYLESLKRRGTLQP